MEEDAPTPELDIEAEAAVEAPEEKPKPAKRKSNTLDWDKPYGTVHGGAGGARYFQDGKHFDGSGKACKAP